MWKATILATIRPILPRFADISATAVISVWVILLTLRFYRARGHIRTTRLKGPPRGSFIYGVSQALLKMSDRSGLYAEWVKIYGPVYKLPWTMGTDLTVLSDPKAVAHFFAQSSWKYHQLRELKLFTQNTFGDGLLITEGEVHMRQRRAMSPAFSNSAIRDLVPIFLKSAYELKAAWDANFQSEETDTLIIEVQDWMNRVSLDSIGEAGFSHRFGSIKDRMSPFMVMLDSFEDIKPSLLDRLGPFLVYIFPDLLAMMSSERRVKDKQLNESIRKISTDLLAKAAQEQASDAINGSTDRSMLGILVRSADAISCNRMSQDEMVAQIHLLLTSGNDNTAAVLTWALIELSYHPDVQSTLRAELGDELEAADPKYEHLVDGLPYLDAFTSEVLRLHSPFNALTRVANEDDIIPLSQPIQTASGETTDRVSVSKGTLIRVPITAINKSQLLWGDDALEFKPQRWLDGRMSDGGQSVRAVDVEGYRHLLTFGGYGPRTCPGRQFSVVQFKLIISVLIRDFSFAFPRGPTTKIVNHRAYALRARVEGEDGPRVPLIVKNLKK